MSQLDAYAWTELAALDRARAVVFLPISPIEAHGPHLPVGTDYYVAQAVCERVAAELEQRRPDISCLLVPPVPIGCGVLPLIGSLPVSQRTVRTVTRAFGRTLARDGFRTIVAVSGHMGLTHLLALQEVAARVSRQYRVAMLAPAIPIGRTVLRGADFAALFAHLDPPLADEDLRALMTFDHGGMLETSVMLHLRPDLVRPIYRALPAARRIGYLSWRGRAGAGSFQGYVGQPARARADVGEAIVSAFVAAAADLVAAALPEAHDQAAPAIGPARPNRPGSSLMAALGALSMVSAAALVTRRSRWRVRLPSRSTRT